MVSEHQYVNDCFLFNQAMVKLQRMSQEANVAQMEVVHRYWLQFTKRFPWESLDQGQRSRAILMRTRLRELAGINMQDNRGYPQWLQWIDMDYWNHPDGVAHAWLEER